MYSDDELLALSGIQHFAFCRRQWALIHVEQQWKENVLTVMGAIMHDRAHNEALREKRGDVITVRGLSVRSGNLGLVGKCDIVEFHASLKGHPLTGEDGLWMPVPVEYKRGRKKAGDEDRLQLCAQAMCLEEMLACEIPVGYLFYGSTHSREQVAFSDRLRTEVVTMTKEMHDLYRRHRTPKPKKSKSCKACSLMESCLPDLTARSSVSEYVQSRVSEGLA